MHSPHINSNSNTHSDSHKDIFSYIRLMFSKPYLGFTLFALAGFFILIALGTWQLSRLDDKLDFIQSMEAKRKEPPQSIEDLLSVYLQKQEDVEFRRVSAKGKVDNSKQFKWMGRYLDGELGYHQIVVMNLDTGGTVLLDLGWLPKDKQPLKIEANQPITIQGTLRYTTDTNRFTPDNNWESNELYAINPKEMKEKAGINNLYPVFIGHAKHDLMKYTKDSESNKSVENIEDTAVYPTYVPFVLTIRNQHLSYALTWFGLSLVWLLCFVFFIRRKLLTER